METGPDVPDRRIAFYPCCATDIAEPREILAPYADEVVYCDVDPKAGAAVEAERRARHRRLPELRFLEKDAGQALGGLRRVDVLFYRRDSDGEGGSRVYVLGDWYLRRLLALFPERGGLIITDGSNQRGGLFRKMSRTSGLQRYGFSLAPAPEQPLLGIGLTVVRVERQAAAPAYEDGSA